MPAHALDLDKTQCVAGAKPGGGFDVTCKLAQAGLLEGRYIQAPMRVSYLPGGIGALAFNAFVTQRPAEAETLVAFSSGSLLNIAQGKFGPHDASDVRWVAGVAADYGVVIVADSSPFKTLKDLMAAIKADPSKIVFGAGGTFGSQDWIKAAMTARAAGVHHRNMRLVAFEGGGEALTALQGHHVQVYTGDASETATRLAAGAPIRVLAVMSEQRLPGQLAQVPTAREAGFDLVWPIVRGFYVGPKVSDADYKAWVDVFTRMLASKPYEQLRSERGLYAFSMTGPELDAYVKRSVGSYRKVAEDFGLKVAK
ncbi:tripartite tricarboxylate transporter substrate-binding protein [Variovorax sp. J22P240]|uniref:Bug family tripartite tricarboxylate transporter substrate binding protein n=1 Tax=unclassified Variovorax TaxID=663243 RepID=UPI0025784918|nr:MULTISPECIES: tripartite tricarboxylate transporter substrate-binding protein [unclassified Variovorax]MDL9998052.1 tripartite tricarboxylate transporter substrate-binding protein [Variovorax sp. J22P240]MDM0053504.1 tripartite tricarboxylate transporter substrate-binding protein [Variovorax sp. J22R115]